MGLLENAAAGFSMMVGSMRMKTTSVQSLAAQKSTDGKKSVLPWKPVATSQTQKDIKTWKSALSLYSAEEPKNFLLQQLYDDISNDLLLTSQVENRNNQLYSVDFSLKKPSGEVDEEQTQKLRKMALYRNVTNSILKARYLGYSVGEISLKTDLSGEVIAEYQEVPRANVVPQTGQFFFNYLEDKSIKYRELQEFGTWILEFDSKNKGLFNKLIPYVLFKKFAVSCWSELCEIYGVPPRFMKTNTQDPQMLARGEEMMRDMGSASWFIIDQNEEFEFAKGVNTNGDVFNNLIQLCNNEISMGISGAIIGQDTKNGSNAKEQSSQDLLSSLVKADMEIVEQEWNSTVIPALTQLGILSGDLTLEFDPAEDLAELWTRTKDVLQYAKVDPEWIKTKFGVEVTEMKDGSSAQGGNNLNYDQDFFV